MNPVRFFYSTDGTDVQGPVTREAMLLLIQHKVVGPGTHLCREGESEWVPLDPAEFEPAAVPRLQPYEPAPFVPTVEALEVLHGAPPTWEESSSLPGILRWVYIGMGIAATLVIYFVGKSLLPGDQQNIFVYLCGFIVAFLLIWGIPALFTAIRKGPVAHGLRLTSTLGLAGFVIWGLFHVDKNILQPAEASAATTGIATNQVAPSPPSAVNTNTASADVPVKELQPLEDQAIGNGPTARAARDMITVTNQFTAAVDACTEAEKACETDMATITSPDDFPVRRDQLMKLRAAQVDVVTYLQNFDSHSRQVMVHNNFPPEFIDQLLAGARKTGHVDELITLWKAKIKFTDDRVAQIDYLAKSYGSWNVREGKVVFTDNDSLVAYSGYLQALQNDIQEIRDEQKKINR
jgi:hypothetical protein